MARRSPEEQKAMYELWRRSGLTIVEFCRQNKISTKSIWRWRKEFSANIIDKSGSDLPGLPVTKDLRFYPMGAVTNNQRKDNFLEATLPNGVSYKVYLSEDGISNLLRELLK
jgi:hypothetical protein